MKKITVLLLLLVSIISCKDKNAEPQKPMEEQAETPVEVEKPKFPENLSKIFEAHGGLATWKEMRTLEFNMMKPDGNEITTTDLNERYSLIEMPKHTIGFDGENVWTKSSGNSKLEKDPKFYYNLMFYFYAMPFILADDGIVYSEADALTFGGKSYPGIKISYGSGVGESPEDEYIIYYDADTHQMTWLGYTVTYFSKGKSKEWSFINYSSWQEVEGLMLPETMTWYNVENNLPTTLKKEQKFANVSLTTDKMDLRMYMMPEGAEEIQ